MGWNEHFQQYVHQLGDHDFTVGRVILEHMQMYRVLTEHGEFLSEVSGKMRHQATGRGDFPAVGDWVTLRPQIGSDRAIIHHVLPRITKFSRKLAGLVTDEQIAAANVDTVFIVTAVNRDFELRRLERYLVMAWESGANPVVILSKADLCENLQTVIHQVETIAFGAPIHAISALLPETLEPLHVYLGPGKTVALLGSSGVGKSTLINALIGSERQAVQAVRDGDDKGRHTTTHREMFFVPQGGIVIDTPGMRELQLWSAEDGFADAFPDIEAFAGQCRFRDCRHMNEPGCAVRGAIESGSLEQSRYLSYTKLQRELAHLARKEDQRARLQEKERIKKFVTSVRHRRNR